MAVFHAMTAGCGGIVHRGTLGPTSCGSEPTTAGLWFAVHGRTVRLGFACDHHVFELEQRLSQGPEACRAVSGIQGTWTAPVWTMARCVPAGRPV